MAERQVSPEAKLAAVWRLVQRIPKGKVATYGDLADSLGEGFTARSVGRAMRLSPQGLRLPWHRVIAAGGRIALRGEAGLEQRWRLEAEGVRFSGRNVRIRDHRWRGR